MTLIKNPDYQFTLAGSEEPREHTCYRTKSEARSQIHEAHNPVLVQISGQDADGVERTWYDTYPLGHPLPRQCTVYYNDDGGTVHATVRVIEDCTLTASGMKWRKVLNANA
jgi:hypothetical protein